MGPKSQEALANGEKLNEFAKSIVRSLISKDVIADPKDLSHITYDQAKHTKVTENFKSLDASKYDKDKVSISQEISDTITLHANSLKPNNLLNSNMVNAMLSTQLVEANISAEDKTKIIFLAAGMISKVAGQETPFQDVLEGTKTLPDTV